MLRIVFMGTPELAATSLRALQEARGLEIAAVVTQPDRPKGRELKLQPSPVKELALARGVPVLQPQRARDEAFFEQLRTYRPELIAVAAFGQILPRSIIELPRHGCLNVHTSLLPKYRGAAPIQWAILNGDAETGVTIMKMDVGLDTGDILAQEATAISPRDDAQTLHDRLAGMGAELLVRTIPEYAGGCIVPRPQPAEGITFAPKIKKEDGRVDWTAPATEIWNHVRGLTPWPGAFTFLPGPKPNLLKIWKAEAVEMHGPPGQILQSGHEAPVVGCGKGALRILEMQREGGRRLTAQQFLAGHPLRTGESLGG